MSASVRPSPSHMFTELYLLLLLYVFHGTSSKHTHTHTVHYPRPAGGGTFSHKEGPPEMQETRDGRPMMMMSGRRRSKTLPAPTQSGGGGAKKEPKFNSCRSSSSNKNTTANLDVNNIIRKSDRVPAASNTHGTVDGLKGASPVSVCLPPFHPLLQPHNKL